MHIGQQVECIPGDDPWGRPADPASDLHVGAIYTIRDIDRRSEPECGFPIIRLEEIVLETVMSPVGPMEMGYPPHYFRPLRKSSIEIFTSMVQKVGELLG